MRRLSPLRVALTVIALTCAAPAGAVDIAGAGSTFIYPVLAKWAEAYKAETGSAVTYESIGSSRGIKQIANKAVDFGASDAPLSVADLDKSPLLQFPIVVGGDIPVVNLPDIKPGELKLTGPVLADIYLEKINKWNDPAITKLNPGVTLPDQPIAVVHRSDGSGTTYIWTDYLAKVSPQWKEKVGVSAAVDWPTGLGGRGNEGVAALASRTPGAIGYVEYAYAAQSKMAYALVQNKEGAFIEPSKASFQAAAAGADWAHAPGFFLMLTDQPGKTSWPITGATFILMRKSQDKPETGRSALQFFDWVLTKGQATAESLGYVPIPTDVVPLIETSWAQVKGADSKPLWTALTR